MTSLAQGNKIVKQPGVTLDNFLGGKLTLAQPQAGFRAGLDSVLLGAAVGHRTKNLLDLGAGVGAAALTALAYNDATTATLVENHAEGAELARQNLAANGFSRRAGVVEIDLCARHDLRLAAGLKSDHYDAVIANPPFFSNGSLPAAARTAARHMPADALDAWVRTAATHAAPGGAVTFIHVAARLADVLQSFGVRFGALTVLPLLPRPGRPAHRLLIRGIKGSRAPLTVLAARALHGSDGRDFTPEFAAIFLGDDRLHW